MTLSLLLATAAIADVPFPGHHSAQPKYWAAAHRWATNFSPYRYDGPIESLLPDANGGVWFGLGSTLEHIDRSGKITLPYDSGSAHTEVIVARRHFPDITAIAFARDGSLWFADAGRRSIGHRTVYGTTIETPVPGGSIEGFAFCQSRAWFVSDNRLFVASANLQKLTMFDGWTLPGGSSIACDTRGNLWYAHSPSRGYAEDGYLDPEGNLHRIDSGLHAEIEMDPSDPVSVALDPLSFQGP